MVLGLSLVLGVLLSAADGGAARSVAGSPGAAARARVASGALRLLYTSDWSGTSQTYAVDPTGTPPGRAADVRTAVVRRRTGDGASSVRSSLRRTGGGFSSTICLVGSALVIADANGTRRRTLAARMQGCPRPAAWSPDSRRVAYQARPPDSRRQRRRHEQPPRRVRKRPGLVAAGERVGIHAFRTGRGPRLHRSA